MKRSILFILIITIAAILIYAFFSLKGREIVPRDSKIIMVTLDAYAPFSHYSIRIDDRIMIYESDLPVEEMTDITIKNVTNGGFEELTSLIIQNDFWSLNESYFEENLQDATSYEISVSTVDSRFPERADAAVYTVSCYGECPESFNQIRDKILELWGEEVLEIGV